MSSRSIANRRWVGCLFGLSLVVAPLGVTMANEVVNLARPEIIKTELFRSGHADYQSYRIPSLAITRQGTLLAAVAGRFDGHGDWGNIDIMLRRSTDGGKTWDEQRVVADDGANTVDNATFIIDPQSDTIYLMYQINYSRAYLKESTDEGVNWSPPHEITAVFDEFRTRDGYNWEVIAMGPGHGITTQTGRMLVPVWLATHRRHRPSISATVYSDDQGKTWQAGEIIVANNERTVNPSEHMLVELADGRIMANIRTESKPHRRLMSVSENGATAWTEPEFVEELYEPICMAGFTTATPGDDSGDQVLLFSHPNSGPSAPAYDPEWGARARRNLTLRVSRDQGARWDDGLVIESGPSAYSAIAGSGDGYVYILYETGSNKEHGAFAPRGIVLAKISLAELLAHGAE